VEQLASQPKWTPFSGTRQRTAVSKESPSCCFGDLFDIKRGIATGANEFFILTREAAYRHELPQQFLRPILPSPRYLSEKIISANADGFPDLPRQYVLLDCGLPPEQVKANYPALFAYFAEGRMKGLDQRYLATKRSPWYRQEQRPVPPFLCTYMGRDVAKRGPFRFFWNQSQALATNVYLLLYPRATFVEALQADRALYAEVFAQLQSIDFNHLIDGGRVYGGALHKIEPRELSRVALPGLEEFTHSTNQPALF
jgi:adenine-specific DNA-methyltransferase